MYVHNLCLSYLPIKSLKMYIRVLFFIMSGTIWFTGRLLELWYSVVWMHHRTATFLVRTELSSPVVCIVGNMKVTFIYLKVTCKFIQPIHLADFLLVVILPILIVVIFIGNESTLNSWPEIINKHVCNFALHYNFWFYLFFNFI